MYRNQKEMAQKRCAASAKRSFNKWMCANYYKLKEKCIFTNVFGEMVYNWQEDIFHNTYLAILDNLTNEKEEAFEDLFISSFKLYVKRAFTAKVKEIVPEETFWKYQKQVEEPEEEENRKEAKEALATQILFAAKLSFSRDEFQIFKLYFESGFNFTQIGDVFGTSGKTIQYRYNNMCGRLFGMFNSSFNSL